MSSFRHVGLVVRDLAKAKSFYQKVFEFSLVSEQEESGSYIDTLVGLSNVQMSWVKLSDQQGMVLELLCYHSHPDTTSCNSKPYPSFRHGCSHVAYTVSNIEKTTKTILEQGGTCISPILTSPDKKVQVAYCSDPEGILFEIVEVK